MILCISPKRISGKIKAKPSKSYAQRIILASAFADSFTRIDNYESSKDIDAAIRCVSSLGATPIISGGELKIFPIVKRSERVLLDAGESATTARMVLPCACALYREGVLGGKGSLLSRPFEPILRCLSERGVTFDSCEIPIEFYSKMQGGVFTLDPSQSSQYLSGLMLALPLLKTPSRIELSAPISSSGYIDITKDVLSRFGITSFLSCSGNERYRTPGQIQIEGDASNAAFFRACDVKVLGIPENTLQKDNCFDKIKEQSLIDGSDIPDLVPILAVYATTKSNDTRIINVERLKNKESNRINSTVEMIEKLGGKAYATDSTITIRGTRGLRGGIVYSNNDHRIVMAAAIASQFCSKDVTIIGTEAVEKSYPHFFADFVKLGGEVYAK